MQALLSALKKPDSEQYSWRTVNAKAHVFLERQVLCRALQQLV